MRMRNAKFKIQERRIVYGVSTSTSICHMTMATWQLSQWQWQYGKIDGKMEITRAR
jgi:hypothetical protein